MYRCGGDKNHDGRVQRSQMAGGTAAHAGDGNDAADCTTDAADKPLSLTMTERMTASPGQHIATTSQPQQQHQSGVISSEPLHSRLIQL